jgi:hypothetical protein
MAFEPTARAAGSRYDSADIGARYSSDLQAFVFALFFAFGGITSLNDVLIPKHFSELISSSRYRPRRWSDASATCDRLPSA